MPLFGRTESSRHTQLPSEEEDELEQAFNPPAPHPRQSVGQYDVPLLSAEDVRQQTEHRQLLSSEQTEDAALRPAAYDFEANFADQPDPSITPINGRQFGGSGSLNNSTTSAQVTPTISQRVMHAVFGQYYGRLATADPDQRTNTQQTVSRGHRRQESNTRDGVFANLSAKPERRPELRGDEFVGGDDEGNFKEMPPSYEAAAADSTPPYWETTIIAPAGSYLTGAGGPDDIIVEGLPVGNLFAFAWNMLVSMSFQFVGFALTYLLHTSHAAKHGSRAGLGITLIQYSFYLKARANTLQSELDKGEIPPELIGFFPPNANSTDENGMLFNEDGDQRFPGMPVGWEGWGKEEATAPTTTLAHDLLNSASPSATATDDAERVLPSLIDALPVSEQAGLTNAMRMSSMANDWLSYMLLFLGWALLLAACLSYYRAWRYSRAIRGENRAATESTEGPVQVVVL